MKSTSISLLLVAASCCTAEAVAPLREPRPRAADHRIPTSYESAVMGRRMLALTPLGTLATVFPDDDKGSSSTQENRPAGLGGMPHGLMEYISDCEGDDQGNPTLLAITIETSFKNIAAGSNVSLAVQWTPPHPPAKRIKSASLIDRIRYYLGLLEDDNDDDEYEPVPYSAANLPRFSLLGHVELIPGGDDRSTKDKVGAELASCFVKAHPDARYWLPGSRIHESHFVRLVVEQVYWVGGFGDRAYIGWIPVEEWNKVTRAEWEAIQLPGEKAGWKEWEAAAPGVPVVPERATRAWRVQGGNNNYDL
ncbi:pyridoxamine 5'-phosphate oxidase-domain-containing protein [Apodospora peruviana]|uniref:Pyridoxamine 5'-phosphate oxidase-domain-containing protein n=1 Tax=Apodospora peruviana TaxID=516989 RepID=A0AAE0IU44_9PEZI|nr:pyridoxamine 5'-phosphate oxidase-domain-containing protein [Apodospora peruviana]